MQVVDELHIVVGNVVSSGQKLFTSLPKQVGVNQSGVGGSTQNSGELHSKLDKIGLLLEVERPSILNDP